MNNLLLTYIKEKKWNVLLVLLIFSAFGIIYYLYGENFEAFLYSAILCIFFGLIIFFARYHSFVQKHKTCQEKLSLIEHEYSNLPDPTTLSEKNYQDMVDYLGKKCTELKTSLENETQNSIDYYTTWVHQIKTPISVMQMIINSDDTEEHRTLAAELFRIEQYVEMVLSYIRLGSTSNDFVFKTYTVNSLIRNSIRKYSVQFIQKKLSITYIPSDISIVTDAKWFCFILEQILSNAVKYTYSGNVTITLSDNGVLSITDTGIGIAPEDLPRLFEKGFTGYNGRSDKKSTGLGLYLCKKIADKLNIKLSVESVPGEGSTFYMTLPLLSFDS